MDEYHLKQMRTEAKAIFRESLRPVNPYGAVKNFVRVENDRLILGKEGQEQKAFDLKQFNRISLVGGGKATAPMAKAMEALLRDRISTGMINVKYGFTDELNVTQTVEASHPLPDENGVKGTEAIMNFLARATDKDLIISLISGGGSALLCQPAQGVSLTEKQALTGMLLDCGASIDEINAVRKHISAAKGGQMARAAFPATVINLMLSDVVGDKMDVIASGPFVPDSSTFEDALGILRKYDLKDVPESILRRLEEGAQGRIPDTPKEGDPVFLYVSNIIVGSNMLALEAAQKKAKAFGYNTLILSSLIEGETRDVARVHCAILREICRTGRPMAKPACIISGGETTVIIRGKGLGGRNQEFCLASAIEIAGLPDRMVVLSGGTDGNDGPTDAAGAVVDPHTVDRGGKSGLSAIDYLNNNDAYHFFEKTEDLLMTGPTNTNVMDVRLLLIR
ncbi:MOFRL family protein [delta proteobacterium NaphS2]|nr:MOFRL family protein [delta proteobacterium NaphS2]